MLGRRRKASNSACLISTDGRFPVEIGDLGLGHALVHPLRGARSGSDVLLRVEGVSVPARVESVNGSSARLAFYRLLQADEYQRAQRAATALGLTDLCWLLQAA